MPHHLHTITQSLITRTRSFFKKNYYNHRHLQLTFQNYTLNLSWQHHDEYALNKQEQLLALQKQLTPEAFILTALQEAKYCNYIIFDCQNKETFVQFWLADGHIMAGWPVIPKRNELGTYLYPMLGVLNELKITQKLKKTNGFLNEEYQYYECKQDEGFDDYQIHFAHKYEEAAVFTILVFTKVFGQKLDKLRFSVG